MRIIFMGSPDFAVPSLVALVGAGHDVVAAYCQPPRPAGRGKAERKTAVHLAAEGLGITVRTPRAILAGDERTGVTIMRMDEGLDTGPKLLQRDLMIGDKNAGQVTDELAKLG